MRFKRLNHPKCAYFYPMKKLLPLLLFCAACGKEQLSVASFREIAMPVAEDLSAVCFRDSLHGIACGGKAWVSGFLLSSSDGGESWSVDTSFNRKMEHVTYSPNGQSFACGQDFLLYRSPAGQHWQPLRADFQWSRAAHFPADNAGAVVSGEGFHSGEMRVFGPESYWALDTVHAVTGELEAVWYADARTIIAVGAGWVIRSADAGRSWERLHVTGDFFSAVHFPDTLTGYICGNNGSILKSRDGGKTWRFLREGGAAGRRHKGFRAIWFTSAEQGWLVGDQGIFWHTDDGGESWQTVAEAPGDADFTDVYVRDGQGWATAAKGRFFVFGE